MSYHTYISYIPLQIVLFGSMIYYILTKEPIAYFGIVAGICASILHTYNISMDLTGQDIKISVDCVVSSYLFVLMYIVANTLIPVFNETTTTFFLASLMVPFQFGVNINYILLMHFVNPVIGTTMKKYISLAWCVICIILSIIQINLLYDALQHDRSVNNYGIMTGIGFFSAVINTGIGLLLCAIKDCFENISPKIKSMMAKERITS